ncbi:MAG: FAD-binding protein, partial [Planctomycetota bacterium]
MTDASTQGWDHTVDLLVVGSGAGAMVSALTACDRGGDVLLIEKGEQYGGSSAMSGGGLWIPNNHLMEGAGIPDTREEAIEYMRATTAGLVSEDRLEAYVDESPKMAKFLDDKTRVEFVALPEYPDYYQNQPGSKEGARAMETKNFDARLLGDEFLNMRNVATQALIMGRICMTIKEGRVLFCKGPGWITLTMKLMSKYWLDIPWRFKSKRDRNLAMGNALVGMLRRSLMDRDIPLWLN